MKRLALASTIAECSQCKLCNAVCPISQAGADAAESPAGAMRILHEISRKEHQSIAASYSMDWCLACGKCEKSCPAHLPLKLIFLVGKMALKREKRANFLQKCKFFLKTRSGLDFLKRLRKILRKKRLNLLAIRRKKAFKVKADGFFQGKPSILLFTGCVAGSELPYLAYTALESLSKSGFHVISPTNLRCCGKKSELTFGSFMANYRANLKILSSLDFNFLVTLCPSCLDSIRNIWPRLPNLTEDEQKLANMLAEKAFYIGSLWQAAPKKQNEQERIFWFSGCQLPPEDAESARRALGIPRHKDWEYFCCGGKVHNEINKIQPILSCSSREKESDPRIIIARNCRDNIVEKKTTLVVTACPHCLLHLDNSFLNHGDKISIQHAVEFYHSGK